MATYQSILDASIKMVCEDADNGNCEDYQSRASYILATFCSEFLPLDRKYREVNGDTTEVGEIAAAITLSEAFPLSSIFVPAATYYLCAMLVIEENETLSDRFFDLYSDAIASIQAFSQPAPVEPEEPSSPVEPEKPEIIPATLESIVNRYAGTF